MLLRLGSVSGSSGTNIAGFTAAGGSSLSELDGPTSLFIDSNGTMYIYDSTNARVQKWIIGQPLGFTVAGGRGVGSTLDKISSGNGLSVDDQGNVYVSENANHRVTLWLEGNTTAGRIVSLLNADSSCYPMLKIYAILGSRWKWCRERNASITQSVGNLCR